MTMSTNTRRVLIWLAIAAAFFFFLHAIKPILLPFVVGIGLAYFLDPAADRLERDGFSRTYATSIIMLAFSATIVLVFVLLVPLISEQIASFVQDLPSYIDQMRRTALPYVNELLARFGIFRGSTQSALTAAPPLMDILSTVGIKLISSGAAFFNILALLMITPVVAFYLLRDWDTIVLKLDILLPRRYADTIREQCRAIDRTLAGFIRGQINVCLILAVVYAICLSLVGLKYALLISIMGGLLIIIPYLGTGLTAMTALILTYIQFGDWPHLAFVSGIFAFVQILESYFLTPKLVGQNVGLHPLWVLFGMLAGGTIFGFVGVLLAVPITAVIGVLVRFAIGQYLESGLYRS
ncbi:MAG: AI-2E family transporter [Rickettsiales bacterium]